MQGTEALPKAGPWAQGHLGGMGHGYGTAYCTALQQKLSKPYSQTFCPVLHVPMHPTCTRAVKQKRAHIQTKKGTHTNKKGHTYGQVQKVARLTVDRPTRRMTPGIPILVAWM